MQEVLLPFPTSGWYKYVVLKIGSLLFLKGLKKKIVDSLGGR